MKRVLVILLVLIVVAAGAGALYLRSQDESTAVGEDDAAALVDAQPADAEAEPGERPEAGTWTYTGSGSDSFDALGGASHEFPTEIHAVVELDPDDACAWTMHVIFVEQHVEERRFCTEQGAVLDAGFDRTTEFIGRRQTSEYECTDDAFRLPADARAGATWTWSCTERRGGHVEYTGRLIGPATVTVGDEQVQTQHVRIDGVQDDDSTGRERTELWLTPNGLPARFTSDRRLTVRTPLGEMTTTEEWDYTLASMEPSAGQ